MFVKADLEAAITLLKSSGGRKASKKGKRIAWMEEGRKPSEALAIFYCKVAYAIEDGLEKYHYHDKALTPPRKDFKPRLEA
jgi:hypothetical protein